MRPAAFSLNKPNNFQSQNICLGSSPSLGFSPPALHGAAPHLDWIANATFLQGLSLLVLMRNQPLPVTLFSLFFLGGGLVFTAICYYLCTHSLFLSPPGQNPYLIFSLLCSPKQINQSVELMICCDHPLHWWPHNIYWVPIMCQASCKVSCFLV